MAEKSLVISDEGSRLPIDAILFCGNIICKGSVSSLSEKGMVLDASCAFSDNYVLDIVFRRNGITVKVPAKVRDNCMTDLVKPGTGKGVYLELLELSSEYKKILTHYRDDA